MFQKLLHNKSKAILFFLAILAFAIIRTFESSIFYDPLLEFFKGDYANEPIPAMNEWSLFINLFFRYVLNTALSVFIIHLFFQNKEHVKVATFLYFIFGLTLLILFAMVLNYFSNRVMVLFYIRRFIIQPIFLLLFIPAFYFQQFQLKKQ